MALINEIREICDLFVQWGKIIETYNAASLFDPNRIYQRIAGDLLNLIFHLQLKSLDSPQNKNYPAIDLGDKTNRIAFQVTTHLDYRKISHTIETFKKFKLEKQFGKGIRFLELTAKKTIPPGSKSKSISSIPFIVAFPGDRKILCFEDQLHAIQEVYKTWRLSENAG